MSEKKKKQEKPSTCTESKLELLNDGLVPIKDIIKPLKPQEKASEESKRKMND